MKKISLLVLLAVTQVLAMAQIIIKFDYDSRGNRVKRYPYTAVLKSAEEEPGRDSLPVQLSSGDVEHSLDTQPALPGQLEASSQGIKLYPSPVEENLNIDLSGYPAGEARVYDSRGYAVLAAPLAEGHNTLPMGIKPAGIYIIKVKTPDKVATFKVVKE
jgi:hypothetical protein